MRGGMIVALGALALAAAVGAATGDEPPALSLGSNRELFVDHYLIEQLSGARLVQHSPQPEEVALRFDRPWEGAFCGYVTILKDGPTFRAYYRGNPTAGKDGDDREVTCIAESSDGVRWSRPDLHQFEVGGTRTNNVVLAHMAPASHNFCPFLDARPGVPADARYKALGGVGKAGLRAFASADGLRWRLLQEGPVLTAGSFDSQNVSFWSQTEQQYVCYFRTFRNGIRRISRVTSPDFLHWSAPVLTEYRHGDGPAPIEHLYTNQTQPYFRAPQIYVATPARFFPGRQVLTEEQARAIRVDPGYFKDTSDAVFMSSRGGTVYDRTFLEAFIRPGIGAENWVSRTNYPALNLVQTSPTEMSLYVQQNYGQPTAYLRRYSLRLDGFASVNAPYEGGEMVTLPFRFTGKRLSLNFATSAGGSIRVELQDADRKSIPGFALNDCRELIGNEIDRSVLWKPDGSDVSALAGRTVRARFVLHDADLYSLQFQ